MAWSRFEPGFTRHPKRMKCGPVASWLWVCSVDHCTHYKTDGWLAAESVESLVPGLPKAALIKAMDALAQVGSWEPRPGGYLVHGYLEHNMSKVQQETAQAASRQRYDRWKSNAVGSPTPNGVANGVANALLTPLQTDLSLLRLGSKVKTLKPLSGSPPDGVLEVLEFLNRKTGRNYEPGKANTKLIGGRLKDGATVGQCKAVISNRARKWLNNPKMDEYLRPKTLFCRENFAQYLGELPPLEPSQEALPDGET